MKIERNYKIYEITISNPWQASVQNYSFRFRNENEKEDGYIMLPEKLYKELNFPDLAGLVGKSLQISLESRTKEEWIKNKTQTPLNYMVMSNLMLSAIYPYNNMDNTGKDIFSGAYLNLPEAFFTNLSGEQFEVYGSINLIVKENEYAELSKLDENNNYFAFKHIFI